jgi:hypothetical protein
MEIHRSARKHGVSDDDVLHAVVHEMVSVDVEPDADPPKVPNAMSESRRPIPRGRSRVGASDIRAGLDAARYLHNPKVAGSNPAPAIIVISREIGNGPDPHQGSGCSVFLGP